MRSLKNVLITVFQAFPTALLTGKYVIYHLQNKLDLLNCIEFVVNTEITAYELKYLAYQLNAKISEITQFEGWYPSHFNFNMKNVNRFAKFQVKLIGDIKNQTYLNINNILIDRDGRVISRVDQYPKVNNNINNNNNNNDRNHNFPGNGSQLINNNNSNNKGNVRNSILDIINHRIRIPEYFNSMKSGILDKRNSYCRMINLIYQLKNDDQDNDKWILEDNTRQFNINYSANKDDDCVICMESHANNITIKFNCTHEFHVQCILKHLSGIGPSCNRCPMCRFELT